MAPEKLTTLAYEKVKPNAYEWTEKAFELLGETLHASVVTKQDVQTARAHGACPRCGHDVRFERVLDVVTGEDFGTLAAADALPADEAVADEFVAISVTCRCAEAHEGRPADVDSGCGINFKIEVRPEQA